MSEKINNRIYYPMLVSDNESGNLIDKNTENERWRKFKLLNKERRDILISEELFQKIVEIQNAYELENNSISAIASLIRKLFFNEISLEKLEENIKYTLGKINSNNANKAISICQFIKREILTIKPVLNLEDDVDELNKKIKEIKYASYDLTQALENYPKLGEQSITSNPLKLRYFPTPVRSSIKNWITDYHDALGAGRHETMDRGNFLFHSENGKRLTPIERQKVSILLKSLDEKTLLDIDEEAQAVVFNAKKEEPKKEENLMEAKSIPEESEKVAVVQEASQKEVMQSRIRQSLNFAKPQAVQTPRKEDALPVFEFEDSDYASTLREKIKADSENQFEDFSTNNLNSNEDQLAGSMRFSFPQKLPVESEQDDAVQFGSPSFNQTEVAPRQVARALNSPDFKSQLSQGSGSAQRDPRVQGNTVDLS